jgi:hypothetical protein
MELQQGMQGIDALGDSADGEYPDSMHRRDAQAAKHFSLEMFKKFLFCTWHKQNGNQCWYE